MDDRRSKDLERARALVKGVWVSVDPPETFRERWTEALYGALTAFAATIRAEERERCAKVANNVSRCMCPYTPGSKLDGWVPDYSRGQNGKHEAYCPFGLATSIREGAV